MKKINYIENLERWRAGFSFYVPIKIRFSETDMFGHMNNISPFIYFEQARIEFLQSLGLFSDVHSEEGIPVVADLQCDFHHQVFFDDTIKLYVKADHVGTTSIDLHYMAINEKEQISFTGRGRLVYIHPKTGRPVPLNAFMKNQLLGSER